jgi:hypothetical protein
MDRWTSNGENNAERQADAWTTDQAMSSFGYNTQYTPSVHKFLNVSLNKDPPL